MLSAFNSNLDAGQDAANTVDTSVLTNLELRFDHSTACCGNTSRRIPPRIFPTPSSTTSAPCRMRCAMACISSCRTSKAQNSNTWFSDQKIQHLSLGGDLRLFRDLIARRDRHGLELYSRKATDAIFHHAANSADVMTFSLVQGTAMGGGFEATLAGNVVVAERGARLGFPEVLFGLFPGMGAYTLLRRRVDCATAKIILGAKNYTAEELHRMGIVDVLCEPGEGEHAVYSYISRQAHRPACWPSGVRSIAHAPSITRSCMR